MQYTQIKIYVFSIKGGIVELNQYRYYMHLLNKDECLCSRHIDFGQRRSAGLRIL